MINRVLIRIKVIQILYSFLLVEKPFAIEGQPTSPTKEKRYAYSLYLDMLLLLMKLARRIERRKGDYPLASTRFLARVRLDDSYKALERRYTEGTFPLASAIEPLAVAIEESGVYKNYLKDLDKDIPTAEENFWKPLITFLFSRPELLKLFAQRENHSPKGVERCEGMLQETVVNFMSSRDNVDEAVADLEKSLEMSRELYFRLLWLSVELTDLQERILDENRNKYFRTQEDMNPNLRFVENKAVDIIRNDAKVMNYIDKHHISWMQENPVMLESLLRQITDSDIYREYMESPEKSLVKDAEFWRKVYRNIIFPNTFFLEVMEEKSVFWNDDLDIIGTFVVKTFKRLEEDETDAILDKYKDEEDSRFGAELMRAVFSKKDTYRKYISDALDSNSWEPERLAFMDMVILETALAEIMNFPKIPLKVSINEYIEIAKSYSTSRSGSFVNGLLATILKQLKSEGLLLK